MRHPPRTVERVSAAAPFVEAITWAGLLLGMRPKHGTHMPAALMHGCPATCMAAAFPFHLMATLPAALRMRWPWRAWMLVLPAAVPLPVGAIRPRRPT